MQLRSEYAVAAVLSYSEALQERSEAQLRSDVSVNRVAIYCSDVQLDAAAHARSDVTVACAVRYWTLVHAMMLLHERSEELVLATDSYSDAKLHTVRRVQLRSDVAVGTDDSYCHWLLH